MFDARLSCNEFVESVVQDRCSVQPATAARCDCLVVRIDRLPFDASVLQPAINDDLVLVVSQ